MKCALVFVLFFVCSSSFDDDFEDQYTTSFKYTPVYYDADGEIQVPFF